VGEEGRLLARCATIVFIVIILLLPFHFGYCQFLYWEMSAAEMSCKKGEFCLQNWHLPTYSPIGASIPFANYGKLFLP
jgi:hypothetical protein